jgi:hypothetical protein
MIRYKSSRQLSISEFKIPFEAKLDENNRWVVLSKIVPWEEFARLYYKNFKSNRGAPTKDARLVLGVIIIKHSMKTDDSGVIEMIQENPYMQYFLGLEAFTYEQVMTPSLLEQQETMYKKKTHQVEDRIVSIHQPHVRPIVRGKAKAKTEFVAKINISLLDGYARVDHFDWDAFNEGQDLQSQVERFRKLTGKYPELVQVDKIYLTRENRRFFKEKGIRYTGEPLGRKPVKEIKSRYLKRKERREAAERYQVEGKFGQGKRGYGLNDIRARLATTSNSWIGAIIFVMNLIRYMRDIPLPYFVSFLSKLMKVRNINIYPVKPQMKLCA